MTYLLVILAVALVFYGAWKESKGSNDPSPFIFAALLLIGVSVNGLIRLYLDFERYNDSLRSQGFVDCPKTNSIDTILTTPEACDYMLGLNK
ncbi:MAG: hypothetical protein WC455_10365 [Dehalococcoidia bacterium]|jgi:hypothetical protein